VNVCVCVCVDEIIAEQQSRAAMLKQRTERTHSMSEPDLTQLRADIKVCLDVNNNLIMVALCNRADHYIFILFLSFFFLLFFSSPNLSGRRLDVYHTLAHGVALVRI